MNLELKNIITSQGKTSNSVCIRIPFWINNTSNAIFCWIHIPKNHLISNEAIIVCNPLGYEYSHAHRTIRHLCDAIAQSGNICLRFDYHGTGNSCSDLFSADLINEFINNIDQASHHLIEQYNIEKISLLGLRLGATLAAEYCRKHQIENLILWCPFIKGKTYVREAKALEKLASHKEKALNANKSYIDSGGFILTEESSNKLASIDLTKQNYLVNNKILIIDRDDLPTNDNLSRAIKENSNIEAEHHIMSHYLSMMAEPQATEIPKKTINYITTWFSKYKTLLNNIKLPTQFNLSCELNNKQLIEKLCIDPESQLFGILSSRKNCNNKKVLLFVNSGSVHHVGPNRIYVQMARSAALDGFPSFRFDLGNLGDSIHGNPFNENHPYPSNSNKDIKQIINYLKNNYGYTEITIVGLCSGAHNTFHAGLNITSPLPIDKIIMINPLAFYRKTDGEFDLPSTFILEKQSQQYSQSVRNLEKWKKLFSGNVDIFNLTIFMLQKLFTLFKNKLINSLRQLGFVTNSQLDADLFSYAKRGIKVFFIIASNDPGKQILMSSAKKATNKMLKEKQLFIYDVEDADHTFSGLNSKKRLVDTFLKLLRTHSKK